MIFKKYNDVESFKADALDALLEDEVQNNLPISIILNSSNRYNPDSWLLFTVTDERGVIVLVAVCTLPYNILLYEPAGDRIADPMPFFVSELKSAGFKPPGVLSRTDLARRFITAYSGEKGFTEKTRMVVMKLDKLTAYEKAPGSCRMLTEDDLSFAPAWEHEFTVDCKLLPSTLAEHMERIKTRLGKDTHFIWEDRSGQPVSQAVHGRDTPNSAVISWVYTPPQFRGHGYATSVVGELSEACFKKGKKYCCLFADAANPVSRGVYKKLGYYDVCEFDEIVFDTV